MSIKIKKTNMANNDEESWIRKIVYNYYEKLKSYYEYKADLDAKYEDMRVQSIDYMRGLLVILSMFMINQGLENQISYAFQNSKWNGMTLHDILVPMFLLVIGSSIPFYVKKHYEENEDLRHIVKMSFIKSIIVFVIGLIFSCIYYPANDYVRLTGPIQMMVFVYIMSLLLYIGFLKMRIKNNALTYIFISMGIIVSIIFTAIGLAHSLKTGESSIFVVMDKALLSTFKSVSMADPEGILVCISGVSLGLIGLGLACILNKKPVENKRYIRYKRTSWVKESGYSRKNVLHDIKSWINPRSIKAILSNYYRINLEARKLVDMLFIAILFYIVSKVMGIWLPLNRNILSLTFVLRVSSYFYFMMFVLYIICDILAINFGTLLVKRLGLNSLAVIVITTVIYKLVNLITIKSIYTSTWLHFNNWFTVDFILPIFGSDYASGVYAAIITVIWILLGNLLHRFDIKLGL